MNFLNHKIRVLGKWQWKWCRNSHKIRLQVLQGSQWRIQPGAGGGRHAPRLAIDTWSIVRPVRMRWRTWPWHTRRVLLVNDLVFITKCSAIAERPHCKMRY